MFNKILIANRGAIACRIIRTLRRMKIASVAVYTEADALSRHVANAGEAYCIGDGIAADSYLRPDKILAVAQRCGAQAIHPGYGFLSENADFAEQCAAAGICFIGPTPQQMRAFGLKHTARALALENQLPLLPGTGLLNDLDEACHHAKLIGYPVMLKSTAGGGGIGMRLCWNQDELAAAYESVKQLAHNHFKDAGLYLEKFVDRARHIEVQIFGDGNGQAVALGERDCSMQRRNQKVIEETPAPHITPQLRQALCEAALRLGRAIRYRSAGTVEFLVDADHGAFYFLEVNTRLQVEHGVTEEVTGIDLVEWMVRLAANELPPLDAVAVKPCGVSIQARIYAENPAKDFQPCSGTLTAVRFAKDARVETWIERGSEVSAFYDPMLAKIIVHAPERETAIVRLLDALDNTALQGIETNLDYLRQIVRSKPFADGCYTTGLLADFATRAHTADVLNPGMQTTVQDYPGRLGYWQVGVPPSGPMDTLAFRLANRLVGNDDGSAALEITLTGPTLRFNSDCLIALAGAPIDVYLDNEPLPLWRTHEIQAGSVLRLGKTGVHGCRAYLAVQGGFQVPDYLGSQSTFTLGQFGGHAGRALRSGDVLHLAAEYQPLQAALPAQAAPCYTDRWEIGVLYGPHAAPDFFIDADMRMFFDTDWVVHHNSNRTGVRLIGPKPQWARRDGGEAGLHPSNIHDTPYAIGAVDFTGDMPVILGPDGPSLGGFVCPVTIAHAELWKTGQLKPGDRIRFRLLSIEQARRLEKRQNESIRSLQAQPVPEFTHDATDLPDPILHRIAASPQQPQVTFRQSGDRNLLIEYGPMALDLDLRFRAHALMEWVQQSNLPGIADLTPGIRSLQIHFDPQRLPRDVLLQALIDAMPSLPDSATLEVPSRVVHLPLSWDDAATRLAIEKYMQSVRQDAPWCPSNIEFIRRINGLDSIDDVRRIVFDASYLVLGLGDVYLGAPVAVPVDPRHRLVTTKYNPARTWTPENAVGIGGAYLCIYGMEGPGGYQFVGRTLPVWNRYRQTADFKDGKPWLLRFFDQIRFFPVSENELLTLRKDFTAGRFKLRIEETAFSLQRHRQFLQRHQTEIQAFKVRQQAAFDAERERWHADGQADFATAADVDEADTQSELDLPPGSHTVVSPITGTVRDIRIEVGQTVSAGETLIVIEAMKMEISVDAPENGEVYRMLCRRGEQIAAGQIVAIIATKPPAFTRTLPGCLSV